jgi:hypothetical protein
MDIKVIGLKTYSFTSKDNRLVEGAKLHYLTDIIHTDSINGYLPIEETITLNLANKFDKIPGVYDCQVSINRNNDGEPILSITDAAFKSELEFVW